jgi:hypothetical protein
MQFIAELGDDIERPTVNAAMMPNDRIANQVGSHPDNNAAISFCFARRACHQQGGQNRHGRNQQKFLHRFLILRTERFVSMDSAY